MNETIWVVSAVNECCFSYSLYLHWCFSSSEWLWL